MYPVRFLFQFQPDVVTRMTVITLGSEITSTALTAIVTLPAPQVAFSSDRVPLI